MVVLDPEHAPDVVTDASLIADAQRGSADAFAALYERHHPRILRHCQNRIGRDDAPDAAQEAFLRAWRSLDGFGGDGRVYPWLRTIATNVCIDTLRRRGRSVPVAEVEVPVVDDGVDLSWLAVHTEAMTAALARLSERHRSVLQLREYEGWTYERIAEHEELDLSAVKSLLWRARQSLRREFLLVSTQGRLAVLGGVLSLGRWRTVAADLAGAASQLGATTGAATAAAVAATVAVPALVIVPSPPPPVVVPRPAAVVVTVATVPPPTSVPVRATPTTVPRRVALPPTAVLVEEHRSPVVEGKHHDEGEPGPAE
ncbi:MAG: polymerase, sigma-24 subunit, subfamily, partial [Actinomycetia bacterium]|nr:polymerase, sigma-24 subunit, subfamily [Actinomycetes bacterium]